MFSSISPDFYNRDMFLVPYYIGLKHGFQTSIVYHGRTGQKREQHLGVDMVPLFYKGGYDCFSFKSEWYFFWYIFRNARKIDCLVRFHFSYQTAIIGWIYKWMNPRGFFYIKGDGYGSWLALFRGKAWFPKTKERNQRSLWTRSKNRLIKAVLHGMCRVADRVSVELPEIYEYLAADSLFRKYPGKLRLMLNGIDDRSLRMYRMEEREIAEKENLIISVGKHGFWQKNTSMFLKALSHVDLKDWKVRFIGTIEERECRFQDEIDGFFMKNPSLKEKVEFTGPIYNQKQLYEYYDKAKVFVHTAVYESYGIVLGEAFRYRNYLVSTPVGIAPYLIGFGYGELCEVNDVAGLAEALQAVVDGKVDLEERYRQMRISNRAFSWDNEIDKLGNFNFIKQ